MLRNLTGSNMKTLQNDKSAIEPLVTSIFIIINLEHSSVDHCDNNTVIRKYKCEVRTNKKEDGFVQFI